jgi:glutamate dehydrogenase (NAD(P)+)
MKSPFQNALEQLARANKVKAIDSNILVRLQKPEREITISIPVLMDSGEVKLFEGYRVQYSSARGPYKGGIRFHPDTNIDEVRALGLWMAIKCAVANIPMGGGKGGITVNPKDLSINELEKLSRGWVKRMYPVLGITMDVPAPDVNTTPQIMAWMNDEYKSITHETTDGTFTGKPLDQGGSEGRGEATGLGGFYVYQVMEEQLSLPLKVRVSIQGMGNVGSNAARIFKANGHTIVAMSDSNGGIYTSEGLDPALVMSYKKEHGSLIGFPNAKQITNTELLLLPCDVLIPAALENQITEANAELIEAKLILELANGPTTPAADDILFARGIPVIPDILANAGGVIVSTFELEQNKLAQHWTEEEVLNKLREILNKETLNIYKRSLELKTDLRRTSFVIALERLEEAMVLV